MRGLHGGEDRMHGSLGWWVMQQVVAYQRFGRSCYFHL